MPEMKMRAIPYQCVRNALELRTYGGSEGNGPKDDIEESQKITFGILAFITLCVMCLWSYNAYLIWKNGRFRNIALALFYLFSFFTLACKSYSYSKLRSYSFDGLFFGYCI